MREELSPTYDVSSAPRIHLPFAREAVHLLTRLPTLLCTHPKDEYAGSFLLS